MEFVGLTTLEDYRGLLYEVRDLAIGGAMYAANISDNRIDAPFNLAMYHVISKNANLVLHLFDIIERMPEVGENIKNGYKAIEAYRTADE